MNAPEMKSRLSAMTNETNDAVLSACLDEAASAVLKRLYPFNENAHKIPTRYIPDWLSIAKYLVLKQGAEGETQHNENGINRTYESAGVPESMLKNIIPYGKIIGGGRDE